MRMNVHSHYVNTQRGGGLPPLRRPVQPLQRPGGRPFFSVLRCFRWNECWQVGRENSPSPRPSPQGRGRIVHSGLGNPAQSGFLSGVPGRSRKFRTESSNTATAAPPAPGRATSGWDCALPPQIPPPRTRRRFQRPLYLTTLWVFHRLILVTVQNQEVRSITRN